MINGPENINGNPEHLKSPRIVRLATVIGRFGADLGGGWRQPVRNTLLRLTPARSLARAGAPIVGWTAP
jgi:hypothetical protein